MAIDVSALTDYAWSDIAKAAKTAMLTAALGGGELTISGRTIRRLSITEAKALYEMAIQMIEDEAGTSQGGVALVRYGERV